MTKAEYYAIVDKYNMRKLFDNEITRGAVGHYVVTDEYVDELDQMMKKSWPYGNVSVDRWNIPTNQVIYKLFPPKNWLY